MKITESLGLEALSDIRLKLFKCGAAEVDESWSGVVRGSVYSRLYYVGEGRFYVSTEGKTLALDAGEWYLIPYGTSYEYYATEPSSHLFIHFNLTASGENDIFGKAKGIMKLKTDERDANEIARLIGCESMLDKLSLRTALYAILLRFIKAHSISFDVKSYSPSIIAAMQYIREHLAISLTVTEISDAVFVSKSTLEKHFRDELSMSVGEFISGEIMFRSAQMLLKGKPLREVSDAFGFCDQFYFSRKFKAHFGITPREYRRSWLGG